MEKKLGLTPTERKYPRRNRKAVNYEERFLESSMEDTPTSRKRSKFAGNDSLSDGEIENGDISETKENEAEESETEEISEYEKLRLKNLEENRRMMIELGLLNPMKEKQVIRKIQKPKVKSKPKLQDTTAKTTPTKYSLRLRGKASGKDVLLELFQESPTVTPDSKEEKQRIEEEVLPMSQDGESVDFLEGLKVILSQESSVSSTGSMDGLIQDMRQMQLTAVAKVNSSRIQGICVHPLESKLLVISGSTGGELSLWNVTEGEVVQFNPHKAPINCVTADETDVSKVFSTSHDGTVRRADLNKSVFDLVYQTDEKSNFCHITWHEQIDSNTLMVAHGTGDVGVVDLRAKAVQNWYDCHPRSIRTIHLHPTQQHYFLSASGLGECKIWDLRNSKKHTDQFVSELTSPSKGKGLTSAFFSPDGSKIVSTCNDDYLRFYDTSDLANPKETHKVMHNNHTGRWLSVFKAVWHPRSSDLLFIGSMQKPNLIQLYSATGQLMRELKGQELTTICPVISLHPSLPVLVGGNSSGKAHLFTIPTISDQLVKNEEDDDSS
ncbi:WD repeat-containing protein 76-like [Homalodisca vitripennis]|uniref:WD repeat-containing protein 76-like n=1 Tax=Homalodisca vitripennis TaxID=197043 RepID=UPI001EEC4756|nr:WD repeat-containing protein 76-like [Homalodisca vitripennis]